MILENQVKLMAIGLFLMIFCPIPSILSLLVDNITGFVLMIISIIILLIVIGIFVYAMTIKDDEWYGIKAECCNDKNILQGNNPEYGQCLVCFRIFTRGNNP